MAKIVEDVIVIKFSRIVKDSDSNPEVAVSNEHVAAIEQVAQELVGEAIVVEVDRA